MTTETFSSSNARALPLAASYVDGTFSEGGSCRDAFRVSPISDAGVALFVSRAAPDAGCIPCILVDGRWYNRADRLTDPAARAEWSSLGGVR